MGGPLEKRLQAIMEVETRVVSLVGPEELRKRTMGISFEGAPIDTAFYPHLEKYAGGRANATGVVTILKDSFHNAVAEKALNEEQTETLLLLLGQYGRAIIPAEHLDLAQLVESKLEDDLLRSFRNRITS